MKNVLRLTYQEARILREPVRGVGGFQSYARRLQAGLGWGNVLVLSDADLGRAIRHISYGKGGFEGRLKDALKRPLGAMLAAV